jgi:hypothetical protein
MADPKMHGGFVLVYIKNGFVRSLAAGPKARTNEKTFSIPLKV